MSRRARAWSSCTRSSAARRSTPTRSSLALRDLSVLADEYDDRIVEEAGGQRMQDLIDASATAAVFTDFDAPRAWDKG